MNKDKVASDASNQAGHVVGGLTWQRGLAALAVVVGAFVVAKLVGYLLRRGLPRGREWSGPVFALSKLLSYVVVFVGLVSALHVLGVSMASVLVPGSALLVGVGFALQNIVQDFTAGIILLVEQPIRKNDFVTFGGIEGTVQQIGLRATHLLMVDGTDVVVPNHLIVTTKIANHSHPFPRVRVAVKVAVSQLEDVDVVRETLAGVAKDHPRVLDDPDPAVRLLAIRDSDFQFMLVAWVRDPPARRRIASELRYAIAHAFAKAGIRFPTPEFLLHTAPQAPNHESAESRPPSPH